MVSNPSRTLLLQLIDSTPVTVARIVYMSMPIEMPIDNQISLRLVILVSRTRKAYYIAHHFFMNVYGHISPQRKQESAERMDAFIASVRNK